MKFNRLIAVIFAFIMAVAFSAAGDEGNAPKPKNPANGSVPATAGLPQKLSVPIKLVVLDPGHGGIDSGAVGPGGVLEKDVVLDVSRRLKDTIEKRLDIKVVLTRENDVFIPLRERSAIANRLGADLFVSIHANAAHRGGWGFETYFLSATASDDESRKLALKENYPPGLPPGMNTDLPPEVSSDLEAILFDMAQTEYIKESEALALVVQDRLANILHSPDRGVKQAPFLVLTEAAMPAVLIEVGFVSSRKEVKLLTDPSMQEKIADALASSVEEFARRRAQRSAQGKEPTPEGGS